MAKNKQVGDWEYKSGEGEWQEWVNTKTGESSIKTYTMHKVSSWDECDHKYQLLEYGSNIQCQKCGDGKKIVWGINFLKDGKIVPRL
jgi:hypothetical protein